MTPPPRSVVSVLAHIHALHAALSDFLLLQDPQDLLRRSRGRVAADHLLDAFLLLADAHQGFQESLLELRHAAAEIRAVLCRGDAARVASAATSQQRAEKMSCVASSVSTTSSRCACLNIVVGGEEAEMTVGLMEAVAASAAASGAVFLAAASMSAGTSHCKKTTMFPVFARKAAAPETAEAALERLNAMERCFGECDGVCDKVFRSIVQTRVALLNLTTPTM